MLSEKNTVITLVAIAILIVSAMVILFIVFNQRKNKLIVANQQAQIKFEQELVETQIEIREETLRNISWELHDNIGQLMTLAKIQTQNAHNDPAKIDEAINIISLALQEIRMLSKHINPESLSNLDFLNAINLEIERFNRLNFIEASLDIKGKPIQIPQKNEIIIFRVLQEFFSNTIKHSRASTLHVKITFTNDNIIIEAKDNGIGFITSESHSGIGVKNMKSRIALIKATLSLQSTKNEGTSLTIHYPIKNNLKI